MRPFGIIILAALMALPPYGIAWGQERPVAAVGRVASLGEVSDSQKQIISNRLETVLSSSYELVSQEQYLKAEEAAFASLDLEKCTEEECIRKIQELLQVDRLFILQIIREVDFTQLTLNLIRSDSKRTVDGICERCTIAQLYEKIDALARQMIAEDTGRPLPEAVVEKEDEEESGVSWWVWALGGLAAAGLAAALGGSTDPAQETGSTEITW